MSPTTVRPWVIGAHLGALVLTIATASSVSFQLPIIARKAFGASDWQTLLITAAPAVLLILSIFWGDVLKRMGFGRYLLTYWLFALVPLAGIALAESFWFFAACFLVASCGGAAWPAVHGEIMKHLYPDRSRGRIYGLIVTFSTLASAGGSYGLGLWLKADPDAFRTFLPIATVLQGTGLTCLMIVLRRTGVNDARTHDASKDTRSIVRRVTEPLSHTREVLRSDIVFARYEAAFMTYGAAWMICEALKPALMTDRLHLDYSQIGTSAFMAFQLGVVACTFIAGMLMDKLGPTRLCVLTFGLYPLYPISLALAQNSDHLMFASVIYGVCTAGVNAGWLLGPVTLAPSPDKVPQYVAIHASLVGLRGTVFQVLAVAISKLSGSFTLSFMLAALGFAWASWQMWRLHKLMVVRRRDALVADAGTITPLPAVVAAEKP